MELETAKLVAFAIWTESDEGIMGKAPGLIKAMWDVIQARATVPRVVACLHQDIAYKWVNYGMIWGAVEEERPAPGDVGKELPAEPAPLEQPVPVTPVTTAQADFAKEGIAALEKKTKPKRKEPKK